ncbi:hypothetical protein [Dictyobacter aurantiacus]|uniref:Uncharacterized protein n=1 Tax=Dictyobacter aurantiacus TaxID=1936993 RepID=A0A401ZT60_9CHLR|nr:hypothetical protein [Dictyobacter aurantiacus]GCE10065.1 hypothetical protein KDAU_73940 [Dictyobacter aurantiacus]
MLDYLRFTCDLNQGAGKEREAAFMQAKKRAHSLVIHIVLCIIVLAFIVPVLALISASLKSQAQNSLLLSIRKQSCSRSCDGDAGEEGIFCVVQ